ncbi:unnamed protein product [Closterium sp. NIES-65]|nr:unnamed protein product [Closterium sp. NIES-65]
MVLVVVLCAGHHGRHRIVVDLHLFMDLVATPSTPWQKRLRSPRLVTVKVLLEAARRTFEDFRGATAFGAFHASRRTTEEQLHE